MIANPTHSAMFPMYSGLRRCANGPLSTSGPNRSLRVREMTPMWRTPHILSASPERVSAMPPRIAATFRDVSPEGINRIAAAIGSGSNVRRWNSHSPSLVESGLVWSDILDDVVTRVHS